MREGHIGKQAILVREGNIGKLAISVRGHIGKQAKSVRGHIGKQAMFFLSSTRLLTMFSRHPPPISRIA